MEQPKAYNPKDVEEKIYKLWEISGFFNPDKLSRTARKKFSIIMAPPNITGSLHMGHALEYTLSDILVRAKRMQGFRTLWLPGTDHAGIAAQNTVEKELKKEGLTRFDLGREKFLERMWQWKEKYGNTILEQLKKLGASCDWSRLRFTMDDDYSLAVEKAFKHYYKKGWIYRDKKVVNWCKRCQTSLSDLELEYKEDLGKLWFIKYPIVEKLKTQRSKGKITGQNSKLNAIRYTLNADYIVVATTRPETMLGDTAVAVNPKDKRYKNLIGQKVILPLAGKKIPIVADHLVDSAFGTGAVKVTPAHDLTDDEIGQKHKLGSVQVIDEKGHITKEAPLPYQNLSTLEARERIIKDLDGAGLIEKIEDYSHQVPKCYRCDTTIELIPSLQWFLKMNHLSKIAIDAVKSGKVKFKPKRWERVYFDWLKNIRDWCISRQLWWGHRIPIEGEEDVLDTWFSSALWPFAALGWPGATAKVKNQKSKVKSDLEKFYPTDVLTNDRGIINLWDTRMIFSGLEFMKKAPFHTAYIHATVLTREGKRMSKSLGTGIDPLVLIEKYGADATRFGIAWQITELQDIRFGEENILMGKKFCNKIYNAARFVMQQTINSKLKSQKSKPQLKSRNLTIADKKILEALNVIIKSATNDLESYRFGKAAQGLYRFFWHDFCDKYIEIAKLQITNSKSQTEREATQKILLYVLLTSLKLLHPFMPFMTEEIYQQLPLKSKKACLMIESWPK